MKVPGHSPSPLVPTLPRSLLFRSLVPTFPRSLLFRSLVPSFPAFPFPRSLLPSFPAFPFPSSLVPCFSVPCFSVPCLSLRRNNPPQCMPPRQHNPAMVHLRHCPCRRGLLRCGFRQASPLHHRPAARRTPVALHLRSHHRMALRAHPFHGVIVTAQANPLRFPEQQAFSAPGTRGFGWRNLVPVPCAPPSPTF